MGIREYMRVHGILTSLLSYAFLLIRCHAQYAVAIHELVLTSYMGVIAVSVVSLLGIPHLSAILFVAPLVVVLYVDLLGGTCAYWSIM